MYCPTGKVRHTSKVDAKTALDKLIAHGRKGKFQIYNCTICGFWHFGHKWNEADRQTQRQLTQEKYACSNR